MKSGIVANAKKNNCSFYFEDYDFYKSFDCIYNFTFPDNEKYLISFIHFINGYKKIYHFMHGNNKKKNNAKN